EAGFLTPMLRNHQQIDTYDHEPWRFGKVYEDIIRKYLKLRYRLLPFLYTQLEEAHRTGLPIFRPLVLNYQNDASVLSIDDEFMIGADLLVAPVMKPGLTSRLVYLPEGEWVDYWTNKRIKGGALIQADAPIDVVPMYVRAGAIIPMGPDMNYVGEKPFDPLTLVVYTDAKGEASARVYEDDGATQRYRQGVFRRTSINATRASGEIQIKISAPEGSYNAGARSIRLIVKSAPRTAVVSLDGKPLASITNDAR